MEQNKIPRAMHGCPSKTRK